LFQEIKYVPIYAKSIIELSLRNLGRKKKDPSYVHVIGKLVDLMLEKFFMTKYVDPKSPIVNGHINNISIPNTLIDLGSAINIMTKETMESIELTNLRPIPIVLQLANRSTVKPYGIVDDAIVFVDSWEYPDDPTTKS
jgi:hypothetical protein